MKRLIALVIAVVFSVTMFCPPVSAINPDPNNPGRWVTGGDTPSGDEIGWHDPTSPEGEKGSIEIEIFGKFQMYMTKYLIIYFIPKEVEHRDSWKGNDPADNTRTDRSM